MKQHKMNQEDLNRLFKEELTYDNYQFEILDVVREIRLFSFFWLTSDSVVNIRTNKFFGYVTVRQQKYRRRWLDTDPFWTGSSFWTKWNYAWKHIEIINNEI